jgi:hypothetical protein
VYSNNRDVVTFRVISIKDINEVIIPHFIQYPLITNKYADFELFRQAVYMLQHKQHLNPEGLQKIVNLRASLNNGLSDKLKKFYPNTNPVVRPEVKSIKILHPSWLAGFVNGEGCFLVSIVKSAGNKTGYQIALRFSISQHNRDRLLIKSIVEYLGCGNFLESKKTSVEYVVTKFSDIK